MTPQKLWVLKARTKTNRISDFCQIVRQDFRIYRNIDHQSAYANVYQKCFCLCFVCRAGICAYMEVYIKAYMHVRRHICSPS